MRTIRNMQQFRLARMPCVEMQGCRCGGCPVQVDRSERFSKVVGFLRKQLGREQVVCLHALKLACCARGIATEAQVLCHCAVCIPQGRLLAVPGREDTYLVRGVQS
jgi:hypothetical protein